MKGTSTLPTMNKIKNAATKPLKITAPKASTRLGTMITIVPLIRHLTTWTKISKECLNALQTMVSRMLCCIRTSSVGPVTRI